MPVKYTEYRRPDPDTEYEELQPIVVKSDGKEIDPNKPVIAREEIVCCTCVESALCTSEQSAGAYATYYLGGGAVYHFGD